MIRNVIYFLGSVFLFFVSMLLYGMLQNSGEIPLEQILLRKNIDITNRLNIIVDKGTQRLEVFADTTFVKSYKIACGRNQSDIKSSAEDYVTPIGEYNICSIEESDNYYKIFKLNFPNLDAAAEAYKNGDISKSEYDKIVLSFNNQKCSFNETKLGANIGIHGIGNYNFIFKNLPFVFNWTNGSISINDESIDELLPHVRIGTKVLIKNSSN